MITSPEAFLCIQEDNKFCNGCKRGVSKSTHICDTVGVFVKQNCLICKTTHKNAYERIKCEDCNRVCVSDECFNNHKKSGKNNGKSICDTIFVCKSCEAICHNKTTEVNHKLYTIEIQKQFLSNEISKEEMRTEVCSK